MFILTHRSLDAEVSKVLVAPTAPASRTIRLTVCVKYLAVVSLCAASLVFAQTSSSSISIRVLNGHNGKPIAHTGIFPILLPPLPRTHSIESATLTDQDGRMTMTVPVDSSIRVIVNLYPTCRYVPKADRQHGPIVFSISQVVSTGYVEANNCSRLTVPPKRGELTLFVRPLHWWERLSE